MGKLSAIVMGILVILGLVFGGMHIGSLMIGTGDIVSAQPGTTVHIIDAVMRGEVGTGVLFSEKNNLLMFYKVYTNGTAGFATFDISKKAPVDWFWQVCGGKGNACTVETFTQLQTFLQKAGWVKVAPNSMPVISSIASNAALTYAVGTFGAILPTFFILPVTPDMFDFYSATGRVDG